MNKNFVVNYTCHLYSKRGTTGLLYINSYLKHIDGVSVNMALYKRYTATYRPWLLNITVDWCEQLSYPNYHGWGNLALTFIMRVFEDAFPAILSGCPFEVRISLYG